MIQYIDIYKLYQHPENPRVDLGDLTELTESIQENGVMQNLTVVPVEGAEEEYYVVIGNRRLQAALLAGLRELPCSVKHMDHKTQIGTMLMENMQREDLTPIEEAHGIQMMLDLGDTVASIAEKTGLSETTVRHRAKLNELDQEVLEEKCGQNITITDLIKLEQIKDPERRNKVLEQIGTANFDWYVKKEVDDEQREAAIEKILDHMKSYADEIDKSDDDWRQVYAFYIPVYIGKTDDESIFHVKKEIDSYRYQLGEGDKLFYEIMGYSIYLYHYKKFTEENDEPTEEKLERKRLEKERDSLFDRIAEKTSEWVLGTSEREVKNHSDELLPLFCEGAIKGTNMGFGYGIERSVLDLLDMNGDDAQEELKEYVEEYPYRSMLNTLYASRKPSGFPADYYGHLNDWQLDRWAKMYDLLKIIGYEMSDEEQQIVDGTHELFVSNEDDGEHDDELDTDC